MQSQKVILQRIKFYFKSKELCHIRKNGIGFIDGLIKSEVIDDMFILVEDIREKGKSKRLFIEEIFDIQDYYK